MACGHEQRESVNESKCRGWGGEVDGDRRVGSVDAANRETRRDQKGVHGRKARRATQRESEHSYELRSGVTPAELRDAGKWRREVHDE